MKTENKKWDAKSQNRPQFKLDFPELSLREEEFIRKFAKQNGYQCIIDRVEHKAIMRNTKNNKVAYIQKVHGDIRLVFNNRFESLGYLAIMNVLGPTLMDRFNMNPNSQMGQFFTSLIECKELK